MNSISSSGYDVAIAGATGAVGTEMLKILASRQFPVRNLYPLGSANKRGRTIRYNGVEVPVGVVEEFDFANTQLALFALSGELTKIHAPRAAEAGCLVVDNSSAYRYDDAVPLVVAEVNADVLDTRPPGGIIANPNCSTMQLLAAINPIHQSVGIVRMHVATYQAVSGAGDGAIEELTAQSQAVIDNHDATSVETRFGVPIAFNAIPHIDSFQDNGFTREEMKVVWESRKMLRAPDLQVSCTAVRVPVFTGHSEVVMLITSQPLAAADAAKLLADAPGVTVVDEHKLGGYPTAVTHAAGTDDVFVGRLRDDLDDPCTLHMWVVSDNIRKGAALNAVQLLEIVAHKHLGG